MKAVLFFLVLYFTIPVWATNNLDKICEPSATKKMAFYETTKKMIVAKISQFKKDSEAWNEFVSSPQYHWIRFTTYKSLPKFAAPEDTDECAVMYSEFIKEKRPLAAREKLQPWANCLASAYKNLIPEMAQKLLDCHGGKPVAPSKPVDTIDDVSDASAPLEQK